MIKVILIILAIYVILCLSLYVLQEKLIFFPEKLSSNFKFSFHQRFEEINFPMKDGTLLNGILFHANTSKGLIFYLHGNAGSLNTWGQIAKTYTDLDYDVLMIDYRGYGKSEGAIESQNQLFEDLQLVYNDIKTRYDESNIIVLGYSIGTGPATKLASTNQPKLLILQAPYYSLTDMMRHSYPIIPTFILKYKFETDKYIVDCRMPIVVFHGDKDEVIYYNSCVKLKQLMKSSDELITLRGQGHNAITDNLKYLMEIKKILSRNSTAPGM